MADTPDYPPELIERVAHAMWLDECDRLSVPLSQWAWEQTAPEWSKRAIAALAASGLRQQRNELVEALTDIASLEGSGITDYEFARRVLSEIVPVTLDRVRGETK